MRANHLAEQSCQFFPLSSFVSFFLSSAVDCNHWVTGTYKSAACGHKETRRNFADVSLKVNFHMQAWAALQRRRLCSKLNVCYVWCHVCERRINPRILKRRELRCEHPVKLRARKLSLVKLKKKKTSICNFVRLLGVCISKKKERKKRGQCRYQEANEVNQHTFQGPSYVPNRQKKKKELRVNLRSGVISKYVSFSCFSQPFRRTQLPCKRAGQSRQSSGKKKQKKTPLCSCFSFVFERHLLLLRDGAGTNCTTLFCVRLVDSLAFGKKSREHKNTL